MQIIIHSALCCSCAVLDNLEKLTLENILNLRVKGLRICQATIQQYSVEFV